MKKLFNHIETIFRAFLLWICYKIGWLPYEWKDLMEYRKNICKDCPLRAGFICAKWKSVTVKTFCGKFIKVKGCNCILILKQLSTDKCPLGKW